MSLDTLRKITEMYREHIEKLMKVLERKFDTEFAEFLATLIILSIEYGNGDAWAGLLLKKLSPVILRLHDKLVKSGVKNIKSPGGTGYVKFWLYLEDLCKADFGDEEINKVLRNLRKYL